MVKGICGHNKICMMAFGRFIICGLIFLSITGWARSDSTRKSISILNRLEYIPNPAVFETELGWHYENVTKKVSQALDPEEAQILLESIKKVVTLNRFDLNPLPANFKDLDGSTLDLIRHILEENALDRSKQFIDEVDRQKFIAQKAKELSITEEDLRAIMNSAYLCKPFSYGIIIEDSKEMLNITANTGVAMYSIQYLDSGTQIQYVGSFQANGYSSTSWAPQDKAERRKSLLSILRSAAIDASRKIASKIRASESFLINATVSSATETKIIGNDRILFYFGKEDDVSLDDRYELYENVMGTDGIERQKYIGFARVCYVGSRLSTHPSPSEAVVVRKNSAIVPGISIKEHARQPYEQRFGFRAMSLNISQGRLAAGETTYFNFPKRNLIFGTFSYGWTINLAPIGRVMRQTFLGIDALLGTSDFKPTTANNSKRAKAIPLLFGFELFAHKRFFTGPLQIAVEGGVLGYYFGQEGRVPEAQQSTIKSVSYRTESFATYYGAGLEYACSIDLNLGLMITKWSGKTDSWKLDIEKSTDTQYISLDNSDRPILDFSGYELKLMISASVF